MPMRPIAILSFVATILLVSPASSEETWDDLSHTLFGERVLLDGTGIIELDAPVRALDAAVVPVTIRMALPPGDARHVTNVTLVVDENPAPVAGTFTLGERAGVTEISTRLRVNAYSPVHAVAELSDGTLHVTEAFVKAAGGCSAPAVKDQDEAMANLGETRLRDFGSSGFDDKREAQVMIRHPNNSGFQRDPITLYYVPAHFVDMVSVRQGDDVIFSMEGGISISEDPSFRFDYRSNGKPITVEAFDTEGNAFDSAWPANGEGS